MTFAERKQKLIEEVLQVTSEEKLQLLEDLIHDTINAKDEIIGFSIVGEPISFSAYKKLVENAEASIANGDFLTQEDLEKHAENW